MQEDTEMPMPRESCMIQDCLPAQCPVFLLDAGEGYVLKPVLTEVRHVYVSLCPLINQGPIEMGTLIF